MQEIVSGNPKLRRILYVVYAVAGLILGSIAVGYGAADASLPTWLPVALAVYAYLGGAFGFGAQSKVDARPAPRGADGSYQVTELNRRVSDIDSRPGPVPMPTWDQDGPTGKTTD